jgi:TRAP-type C4-dicarboxylate transport system permease large subunit
MKKIIVGCMPMVVLLLTALLILSVFPEIALYLPRRM